MVVFVFLGLLFCVIKIFWLKVYLEIGVNWEGKEENKNKIFVNSELDVWLLIYDMKMFFYIFDNMIFLFVCLCILV